MSKNTKISNPMKVITGSDTRWSYANIWEPKSINGGTPKYSVSLIIPKSDAKTIAKIKAAIEAAYKEGEAYYVPISANREEAQKQVDIFRPFFEDGNIEKVGQNLKYDILSLRNYGIRVRGKLFDTMIAHYLLNPELRHGMDYMAETYLKYKTIHIDELIGPKGKNQKSMRDVDKHIVCEYASEDADITLKLKKPTSII